MGFFDMEDFRDPKVVEAEKQARKEKSMVKRAVNSGLDIAHQMLQANEMALHISLRDAMNDEMQNRSSEYASIREAAYMGTSKDNRHVTDIEAKAEKSAKSMSRMSMSDMRKSVDPEFY